MSQNFILVIYFVIICPVYLAKVTNIPLYFENRFFLFLFFEQIAKHATKFSSTNIYIFFVQPIFVSLAYFRKKICFSQYILELNYLKVYPWLRFLDCTHISPTIEEEQKTSQTISSQQERPKTEKDITLICGF